MLTFLAVTYCVSSDVNKINNGDNVVKKYLKRDVSPKAPAESDQRQAAAQVASELLGMQLIVFIARIRNM